MGAKVIGVDINDATLQVFKKQGGDLIFNSRSNPDYAAELKKATGGGAHAVAVFSDANAAYAGAPSVLRVGGLLMCGKFLFSSHQWYEFDYLDANDQIVGLPKDPISIPVIDLCCGTMRIKGESTSVPSRMHKAVDFTIKHNILPEVEFRKLEELSDMIDEMNALKATKRMVVAFDWWHSIYHDLQYQCMRLLITAPVSLYLY
jgi:D-arabinose 1-dehydrogenase-like Zn-dependent alcohol dehydrogenase